MDIGITAAIIAAVAAILVAILGNIFTLFSSRDQIRQNEKKSQEDLKASLDRFRQEWVTDLQTTYELERYKARLASYPEVFKIIGKLSHGTPEPLTPEKAKQVAYELNDWFYNVRRSKYTRSAIAAAPGLFKVETTRRVIYMEKQCPAFVEK